VGYDGEMEWRTAPHSYDNSRLNVETSDDDGSWATLVEDVEPDAAKLIAAAPDMLALLRDIEAAAIASHKHGDPTPPFMDRIAALLTGLGVAP